ncbi:hypothetical protein [Moraxella bovoculi]|uniref:hypothetical protein n=1 Tax=Moraxella bovoculi TaxID=386891 RepID=UPI0011EA6278|nr:hypothetical protein [Moraxella bovoculi]
MNGYLLMVFLRHKMFFEIQPFESMEKHSFRLANHYLSKDVKNNSLTGWAWELSDCQTIIDGELLNDSLPKKQLKDIYKDIQRGKIIAKYQRCLNQDGELFLHDVFDKVGSFTFFIYEEDSRPSNIAKKISIKDLRAGFVIDTGVVLLVA